MTDIYETLAKLDELEARCPDDWDRNGLLIIQERHRLLIADCRMGNPIINGYSASDGLLNHSAVADFIVLVRNAYPQLAAHLRQQAEQLAKAREIIEAVSKGYSGLTVKHRAAAWLADNNGGVSDGRG